MTFILGPLIANRTINTQYPWLINLMNCSMNSSTIVKYPRMQQQERQHHIPFIMIKHNTFVMRIWSVNSSFTNVSLKYFILCCLEWMCIRADKIFMNSILTSHHSRIHKNTKCHFRPLVMHKPHSSWNSIFITIIENTRNS